ncbi:MAG: hypothetical protein KC933_23655 [Myxococcales bacterium]|nr:hypothetical protein [Myxococcales bacterium]
MRRLPRPLLLTLLLAACPGEVDPPPGDGTVTPDVLAAGGDCAAATGAGTMHTGTVTADEVWSAAGSPHVVQTGLRITATVVVEPCARVLLGPGAIIEVGTTTDAGRLVASGEVDGDQVRSVTFDALDAAQPWGQLYVAPEGTLDLSMVAVLRGGGTIVGQRAALAATGVAGGTNDGEVLRTVRVRQVLVQEAAGHGVDLSGWAAFTEDSHDLWIRDSGADDAQEALHIEAGVASSVPTGIAVSGNRRDEIRVSTSKAFLRDDTFVARGVPYRVVSTLYIAPGVDAAPVTLAVEAGATLMMEAERHIIMGSTPERLGILRAEGTAAAPVVFTSAASSPAPGDWGSLYFRYFPTTGSSVRHARIEYAGGESGTSGFGCGPGDNDAAVIILGQGTDETPPGEVFVQDTTFAHNAGTTVIVSGWVDDEGPNFAPGNTFEADNPACKVSRPRRTGPGDYCDGGRRDSCWE